MDIEIGVMPKLDSFNTTPARTIWKPTNGGNHLTLQIFGGENGSVRELVFCTEDIDKVLAIAKSQAK